MTKKRTAAKLKLIAGRAYIRRDGGITDPLVENIAGTGFVDHRFGTVYRSNGKPWLSHNKQEYKADLVSEVPVGFNYETIEHKVVAALTAEPQPIGSTKRLDNLLSCVLAEVVKARVAYPDFNSLHEGFSVLKEEVDELWDEVKKKQGSALRPLAAKKEAIQVAAMALRLILDCCEKEGKGYGK